MKTFCLCGWKQADGFNTPIRRPKPIKSARHVKHNQPLIPAQAGIHKPLKPYKDKWLLDPDFRRDEEILFYVFIYSL